MTETKRTILLVDDDNDYRFQQKTRLEAAGYRVVEAADRPTAEAWLADNAPDLALVDLMMGEMDDGFVLCYRLKSMTPPVPVIMITAVTAETGYAFDAVTDEERSWIKADRVLQKPVRFEQLQGEIDRLLTT